jgi:hypothetical protein
MADPVHQKSLYAPVRHEHLHPADAAGGRVSLLGGGEIVADFAGEAAQRVHGAKNGVLM